MSKRNSKKKFYLCNILRSSELGLKIVVSDISPSFPLRDAYQNSVNFNWKRFCFININFREEKKRGYCCQYMRENQAKRVFDLQKTFGEINFKFKTKVLALREDLDYWVKRS